MTGGVVVHVHVAGVMVGLGAGRGRHRASPREGEQAGKERSRDLPR
ncbi:MAG: hypothetical protein JO168_04455 [Solirubrobacterales bacterium]|nr:hypothetical protein [Solirubrobacterales bacterium]